MIELGKYQTLEVINKTDFGVYLGETGSESRSKVLLPKKEIPDGTSIGDKLSVFIYKDSEDREIATTANVPMSIGETAVLKVKEVNKIGAFLDWGLAKDLLLPYKEQTSKIEVNQNVLVTLYLDKSKRLCATMKVYDHLRTDSPYQENDMVEGIVYEIIDTFGVFVAVDHKYSAMIPRGELMEDVKVGDMIKARINSIREDGKLTLSLRQKAYLQMDSDAEVILSKLKAAGGFLPYHDKTDAEVIKSEFKLGKNAFKRAIGKLYKTGAILITKDGIRLK
jgi:predicted RNA-binding protein (virulence factor B family)